MIVRGAPTAAACVDVTNGSFDHQEIDILTLDLCQGSHGNHRYVFTVAIVFGKVTTSSVQSRGDPEAVLRLLDAVVASRARGIVLCGVTPTDSRDA